MKNNLSEQHQIKAKQLRQDLYQRVERFRQKYQCQFDGISKEKKDIIKSSCGWELTELMDEGKLTSQEIMLTFIQRTAKIGVENNYLVDQMFEEAIARAKEVDVIRQKQKGKCCWRYGTDKKDTFPPFFGVPVSLKENILLKGKISHIGFIQPSNPIQTEDTQCTILLNNMGLIPFVRTSTPQGNKTFCTNNNIFGYCKNPWKEDRSCSGSSGGQAGMVGSHCSPMGIGNDIAGSLRSPADFNGIVTLKPFYRYSNIGIAPAGTFSGGLFLRCENGVYSKSIKDVILWNQFMVDKQNYVDIPRKLKDPYLRLTPFRNQVFNQNKRYKIGYFTQFKNSTKCSPSHFRAVHQSLKIAQSYGHTTEEIQLSCGQEFILLMIRIWYGNPNVELLNQIRNGQSLVKQYQNVLQSAKVPPIFKPLISSIASLFEPRIAKIIKNAIPYSIKEYLFMVAELQRTRQKVYNYLIDKQIDLIICPGFGLPAFMHGQAKDLTYYLPFTVTWSLLNYPAGSLPVTTVREDEQHFEDFYHDLFERQAKKCMEGSKGLPTGIQVVSYPGHEQQVLHLMQQLEQKINFRQTHKCKSFDIQP